MRRALRKNLLDLQYTTQLQHFSTTIILLFTFLIRIAVALLTGQVDMKDSLQVFLLAIMSAVVLGVMTTLLLWFKERMQETAAEIERL